MPGLPYRAPTWFRASALLAALLALTTCFLSGAEESRENPRVIAVITHPDNANSEVTRAELGRMFMKKTTLWRDGQRCIPIDQSGTSEIRALFYRAVLDRSVDRMKRYWMRETMTGNTKPPVSLDSSSTVKKYVHKIRNGIAYIYEDEVDETVKVLHVTDMPTLSAPDREEEKTKDLDSPKGDAL